MKKRPFSVTVIAILLAAATAGCITVHPDAKPKAPTSTSANDPFTEVTSNPQPTEHPTKPTAQPSPDETSHSAAPSDSNQPTSSSTPSRATPLPAHSAQTTMPALPPRAADPCSMMANATTKRLASEVYGENRIAEVASAVLGQPSRTCRIGTKPSLRVMTVMDSADLRVWRTAVQSAKDAGNFVPISELGTKAFCGGNFVGAVRVGQLEIFLIDPDRKLGRSDAIELGRSLLTQLS